MLVLDLAAQFEKQNVPYVIVGGYALAFQGIVRATMDVDVVIGLSESQLVKAESILLGLGLQSRIPVRAKDIAQFHDEYRKERNLIAWSFVDFKDPTRQVDLLIYPPIKTVKSEIISIRGVPLKVATKKALLAMKRAANRPEDQLDILKLEEALNGKEK